MKMSRSVSLAAGRKAVEVDEVVLKILDRLMYLIESGPECDNVGGGEGLLRSSAWGREDDQLGADVARETAYCRTCERPLVDM